MSWNKLCGQYEGELYEVKNEDFFHAPPRVNEDTTEKTDLKI